MEINRVQAREGGISWVRAGSFTLNKVATNTPLSPPVSKMLLFVRCQLSASLRRRNPFTHITASPRRIHLAHSLSQAVMTAVVNHAIQRTTSEVQALFHVDDSAHSANADTEVMQRLPDMLKIGPTASALQDASLGSQRPQLRADWR